MAARLTTAESATRIGLGSGCGGAWTHGPPAPGGPQMAPTDARMDEVLLPPSHPTSHLCNKHSWQCLLGHTARCP